MTNIKNTIPKVYDDTIKLKLNNWSTTNGTQT